jgi:hypothetical protein
VLFVINQTILNCTELDKVTNFVASLSIPRLNVKPHAAVTKLLGMKQTTHVYISGDHDEKMCCIKQST